MHHMQSTALGRCLVALFWAMGVVKQQHSVAEQAAQATTRSAAGTPHAYVTAAAAAYLSLSLSLSLSLCNENITSFAS
jgi:hypothetical protein